MKKETVLKFLAYSCFLIPGNLKSRKGCWCLSPLSLLCLITIVVVILSSIHEFLGYKQFTITENIKKALQTLKHVPPRPIGFCLKPLQDNESYVEIEGENGISIEIIQTSTLNNSQNNGNNSNETSNRGPIPHPMSDLEDIVSTASRLLIFLANIFIRIFVLISIPNLIGLFARVFQPQSIPEKQNSKGNGGGDPAKIKNGFMSLLWYESAQRWSTGEKVFLLFIIISQLQREIHIFLRFYTSISKTGLGILIAPCLAVQILMEQSQALLAKELVTEIVAFFLVVVMKTFVNVIGTIAGGKGDTDPLDDPTTPNETGGFFLDELGNWRQLGGKSAKQSKTASDMLFVKTRAMLMKGEPLDDNGRISVVDGANGGIGTIDEHISGIIGGGVGNNPQIDGTFRTTKRFYGGGNGSGGGGSTTAADVIYSEINFVISTYFDLMGIWDQASKFTGFVALVLFCELTTTFCFNTYITLDNAMNYGLFSQFGAGGIMRGITIVAKLVCICNAAQELIDMTPILLDRILKLKLRLLSLPIEYYRRDDDDNQLSSIIHDKSQTISQCERCRGLGSFLSEMVSYIRAHPFELTALGYFTVSRSTLTTITGVIVTYLVVLVQFQSYAAVSLNKT